jgi:hypothetical protein
MRLGCLGIILLSVGGLFLIFGLLGGIVGIGFGIVGGVIHAVFSIIGGVLSAIGGIFRAIF